MPPSATVAWTDWNLLLDETGGPNHVGNLCSAPILVDTKNDEVMLQSSYYYIGHIAKFVRPGAQRILCATNRESLEATAFVNPDGSLVIVVMNRLETPQKFSIDTATSTVATSIPQRSMVTFVTTAP